MYGETLARQKEDNEVLIWLSCLEKPRSILQINKIWGIKSSVLYKGNLANNLISKKMLVVDHIESKNVYYKSIFDGFKDEMSKMPLTIVDKTFLKDWKTFKGFLENDFMREKYYEIDALKSLLFNDSEIAKSRGYHSILAMAYMLLWLGHYKSLFNYKDDDPLDHCEFEKKVNSTLYYSSPWVEWCPYYYEILSEVSNVKSLSEEIKKTEYYKEYLIKRLYLVVEKSRYER